jgi:hypothetical protein
MNFAAPSPEDAGSTAAFRQNGSELSSPLSYLEHTAMSLLLPLLAILQLASAAPLVPRQCVTGGFTDTFQGGSFSANWRDTTSGVGVGRISPNPSGSGIDLVLTAGGSVAVSLQSLQRFTAPATFSFTVKASDQAGVMSAIAIFDGTSAKSEIDIEQQGGVEHAQELMMPIWNGASCVVRLFAADEADRRPRRNTHWTVERARGMACGWHGADHIHVQWLLPCSEQSRRGASYRIPAGSADAILDQEPDLQPLIADL